MTILAVLENEREIPPLTQMLVRLAPDAELLCFGKGRSAEFGDHCSHLTGLSFQKKKKRTSSKRSSVRIILRLVSMKPIWSARLPLSGS